jgi:hypothetical protein
MMGWFTPCWRLRTGSSELSAAPRYTTKSRAEGVEPTNNAAECALRPGVLGRQGSFGTQRADGSRFVEALMTVGATLKPHHC